MVLGHIVCLLGLVTRVAGRDSDAVPDLESMRIEWANMPLRQMPTLVNFVGAVSLRRDIVEGGGFIGLGPMSLSPYLGNFLNSTMVFDGRPLRVENVSWDWCEGTRSAARGGLRVANSVRAPFEGHGVMHGVGKGRVFLTVRGS